MISDKILDKQLPKLPEDVEFCNECVVSNQRPRIHFDSNGVCGACNFTDIKNSIDWDAREKELKELCDTYRRSDGRFDVIVPVSGGKDSSKIAYTLKYEYNMHPLTVTYAPFEYTPIGYKNFRNFCNVGGFTNLMGWPNGKVHRKLTRISFEALGDAWQPFAFGQVFYVFNIAKAFDIKLVMYGENGEAEYSGDPEVYNLKGMPYSLWKDKYLKGITVDDLIRYGLTETNYLTEEDYDETDLTFYRLPEGLDDVEFNWLSYYLKWVPQENFYFAVKNTGFKPNPDGRSEGTYSKYASLDDQLDGFHYYMAFIKFGIGRCTSDAAHEIRDGHITRDEGISLVGRYDGEFPIRYYKQFLKYLQITEQDFWAIVDKFRRENIWIYKEGGLHLKNTVYRGKYPYLRNIPTSFFEYSNKPL